MYGIFSQAFKYINGEIMFPRRYSFLSKELSPFLTGCTSMLDVGSSNGRLAKKLTESQSAMRVEGVDIQVQPESVIPIMEYDGKTLPFADDSFDCVMFIDVLHHTRDPDGLVAEAKRVSRKHILIKDHYWNNALDRTVLKWADYFGNDPFNITLPYNYLQVSAWHQMFKSNRLEVLHEKLFTDYSFDPCKHVIYHLQKDVRA